MWKSKNIEEISYDKVIEIITSNAAKDADVVLQGGETVLYSDIIRLVKYLNDNGRRYFFITNGLAVSKIKEVFYEAGALKVITLSMDGIDDKHDKIRGVPGNFKKLLDLMEWIESNYPSTKIRISYTISPYNTREDFDQVYQFCMERNYDIKVGYFIDENFYHSKGKHADDLYFVGDKIPDPYLLAYPLWKSGKLSLKCEHKIYSPDINYNGDVIVCVIKYFKLGNVNEKPFDEIWDNFDFDSLKQYENCNDCWQCCYRNMDARKVYKKFIDGDFWRPVSKW
jgi:MoaA/NifB/PqqE/SkfB family radical SAM enzyme